MLKWLAAKAFSQLYGDGFVADLAGRGTVLLGDGIREAIDRDPESLTSVRLKPGESYVVVARPPATRAERKAKRRRRKAKSQLDSVSHPTRRQLKSARRLSRTQRKLGRKRHPESRRGRRLQKREAEQAERFDRVTTPTKRQVLLRNRFEQADAELTAMEAASFDRARRGLRRRPRRGNTKWYD